MPYIRTIFQPEVSFLVLGKALINGSRKKKAEQIQEMINDPEFSFKEIAEELGFSSSPHLTTYCQRMFGMTPQPIKRKK